MNIFQITSNLSQACQDCTTNPVFFIRNLFSLGHGFARVREVQANLPVKANLPVNKLITERVLKDKTVIIEIKGNTVKEFINSYNDLCNQLPLRTNGKISNTIALMLSYGYNYLWNVPPKYSIGQIILPVLRNKDTKQNIYNRLRRIGIVSQKPKYTDEFTIRLLCNQLLFLFDAVKLGVPSQEPFTIKDQFSFMLADKEIEKTFKQIIEIGEAMMLARQTFRQNFSRLSEKKLVSSERTLVSSNIKIPKTTGNTNTLRKRIAKQVNDQQDNKRKALLLSFKQINDLTCISNNNKPIVRSLKPLEEIYPSQFIAYLYFEALLEYIDGSSSGSGSKTSLFSQDEGLNDQHSLAMAMFVECLRLLYPYAQKVTQQFNITLDDDKPLQNLLQSKGFLSQFTKKIGKYEELQSVQKKAKRPPQNNKVLSPITNNEPIFNFDTSICLETKKTKDDSKDKKPANNPNISIKSSKLDKDKERNLQIFADHQSAQKKKTDAKREKQMEGIKYFYDLPPRTFITEYIVEALTGDHKLHFNMLFCKIHNDRQMTNENIRHLAKTIHKILLKGEFQCADFFLAQVKKREHHRHTDGKELPEHWLNLRRTSFILFGIFPKDWEPQTSEDRDAMIKYENRCYQRNCIQIYEKTFAK